MSSYSYNLDTDFAGGADFNKLRVEIADSAIVEALLSLSTSDRTCTLVFANPLSTGDETILDGLVAAHDPSPLDFRDLFVEREYDAKLRLIRETAYAIKKPDGTFSFRVTEATYSYSATSLLSETRKRFDATGAEIDSISYNYVTEKQAAATFVRKEKA